MTDDIDTPWSAGTRFNAYVSAIHNSRLSRQAMGPKHFSNLYD